MNNDTKIFKRTCTFFLSICLVFVLSTVCFSVVSQTPLFLTASFEPNIMILLDNSGSMNHLNWHTDFDPY
ncbi:MAG: hypothetical protein PHG20_10135, partial [Geobacteraceae bacterium]|nr:hypothetical protein [Geobacteraceae bacterium]